MSYSEQCPEEGFAGNPSIFEPTCDAASFARVFFAGKRPGNRVEPAEVDIGPWTPLTPLIKSYVRKLPKEINSTKNQLERATDCLTVSSFTSDWMLWDKNRLDTQGTKVPCYYYSI